MTDYKWVEVLKGFVHSTKIRFDRKRLPLGSSGLHWGIKKNIFQEIRRFIGTKYGSFLKPCRHRKCCRRPGFRIMNLIVPITTVALFLITLYNPAVEGTKEEPEEDFARGAGFHGVRGPARELLSLLGPEELIPLCSSIQTYYDRFLKRGPTFNAWGGKRAVFSRQFGKRNSNSNFNPWGGKRSEPEDYTLNSDDKIPAAHV